MDNQFVPNLTLGPPILKKLRPHSQLFFDVHMMVINPESLVEPFASAGADNITFHIEASENPDHVINQIKSCGKKVGISLKPNTPVSDIEPWLDKVDLILVMSVEPGFGGQGYLNGSSERIANIRKILIQKGIQDQVKIEVDGGVKLHNAKEILNAGADILVAGSEVFGAKDPIQVIKSFYQLGNHEII